MGYPSSGNYDARQKTAQGVQKEFSTCDLFASKRIIGERGNLILTANIFSIRVETALHIEGEKTSLQRRKFTVYDGRSNSLTMSYSTEAVGVESVGKGGWRGSRRLEGWKFFGGLESIGHSKKVDEFTD